MLKAILLALGAVAVAAHKEHRPVYRLDSNLVGTLTMFAHATPSPAQPRFAAKAEEYKIWDDHSPMLAKGFRTWSGGERGQVRFKNVDASVKDVVCRETGTALQKEALAISYQCHRDGDSAASQPRFRRGPWSDGGRYTGTPGQYWNGGAGQASLGYNQGGPMYGYGGAW